MSMNPKPVLSVHCTLAAPSQRARLPLAIAGLLLTAQAQAFLPSPLLVLTTGELAPTSQPAVAKSNAAITPATGQNDDTNKANTDSSSDNSANNNNATTPLQNTEAEPLLATWRQQVQHDNLAQHTTWRRLLYFLMTKKPFW